VLNKHKIEHLKIQEDPRNGAYMAHISIESGEPKVFWPKDKLPVEFLQSHLNDEY
jgi:hypothetical protein